MARNHPSFALVLCCALACVISWLDAVAVAAQEPLRAVVFRTASAAADIDIAAAVDPVVLAQIEARGDLKVAARPALDLPATQIAIDCVGETQACLNSVLEQYTDADVLIAPSIQRVADETVVTFLYADPRGSGEFRTVVGRYRGADVAHQALDAVPSMLRALLNPPAPELPAAAPPQPTAPPPIAAADAVDTRAFPARAFPVVPVVLLGSALMVAGVGLAFGFASHNNQDRYDDASTRDPRAVDAAIELRSRAHQQATIANVSYGIAAAAFVLGATWLVIDLGSAHERERTSLSASLSPSALGLVLTGPLPRAF